MKHIELMLTDEQIAFYEAFKPIWKNRIGEDLSIEEILILLIGEGIVYEKEYLKGF